MHNLKLIRSRLGVTQQVMAGALGCAQSNIGHYERGQTLPPDMARKLIDFAAARGLVIGFDHVYGDAPLTEPEATPAEPARAEVAHG